MFNKLELLDKIKHAKLKIRPIEGFAFAAGITYSFLGGSELAEASKYFPIVFPEKTGTNRTFLPIALFSVLRNENFFVSSDGKWKVDYIPNHIKRYPFIFSTIPEKENQFALMLDMEAPEVNEEKGTPLFDESGEPGKMLDRAKKFLTNFQLDIEKTKKLLPLLEEKDVLISRHFSINQGDEKKVVKEFMAVDVKKLEQLDDATLAEWVRNGLMGLIFAHLNSLSNLQKLAVQEASQIAPEGSGSSQRVLN